MERKQVEKEIAIAARAYPTLQPLGLRAAFAAAIAAGVLPATIAVSAAGATLGFFAWFGLIPHLAARPTVLEGSFVIALPVGVVVALALWVLYARYFAVRTGVSLEAALRYDALPWSSLLVIWGSFVGPFGASATGRTVALGLGFFVASKVAIAARFNRTVRDVLLTFLITRISIVVIAELASVLIAQRTGTHVAVSSNPALVVWGRWDAVHFLDIATKGYYGTDMAFFPLYPMLIALLGRLTGSHLLAGLAISNAATFFGLLFFYKLVEHQYNRQVAQRAIFYVSIFPMAIFFSAVYTEPLFFALTVAAFYYIRERRWVTAGLLGALASATRVEGVLLAVPFVIEWFVALPLRAGAGAVFAELRKRPIDTIVRPLIGTLLIPVGLGAYMIYLWILRGDPLYFSHVQIHWNRHLAPPWVSIMHSFALISKMHFRFHLVAGQLQELAFTALMLVTLIIGFRRLRFSYWVYMALSILVPMSTSSLMSMPRFALVLFPMFVLFALWGERHAFNNGYVAFSLPLLGLYTVLFTTWYWVA